ncbi:hypothetical protein MMA231_04233 (plasmid) [Asticcacaulis sp. MM231]|uniref:hypothetical protein n=1 Tax=Asticcacaulis sp. MM231 TaxID=3157666 RepID=UPI0032D58D0B
MIVSDTFAFLHLHKSGGTFVNHMMIKCLASARRVGYHLPYSEMPDTCRHLAVLGTVRNPWAYYVSWYHFQNGQERPNPLFLICSENRSLDFAGTIRNLVTLADDSARVERLAEVFPDHFVNYGLNLRQQCIERIRGSGAGFYSFLYNRLYAGAASPNIIPMERLRETLFDMQLGLNAQETLLTRDFLRSVPKLNVSDHGAYQDYYTPELRDLVALWDHQVIDAYDYRF